ncbi:ABC transporter ATP-binding protein [Kiritimatiella glycovorans]|uniref:Lipoprotein-releasing system ATP-binding protein LolD n=1 Tax=Kiritimatiella glycovorans TaxID=1307763 RepID=A0A0G3EML0_9BACT|nr:ABC transporter ATP-binding protein [Kiritimatiella glycovorans]AKJ65344.1 Lipoprotein-releasing system ATP-binding protein LolD [Kiritimatiella glycovorans]
MNETRQGTPGHGDAVLRAEGLSRLFRAGSRTLTVLDGVSLSVQAGESLAITGASGAGKSTLLYLLGGLDTPSSGRVLFRGAEIGALSAARRARFRARSLGFVFQSYHLLPEMNVLENCMLPDLALERPDPARARERAAELLERVGLQDRMDHRPAELSGGERQRAAVARALINEPDILMADEPTGNLDSGAGRRVLDLLLQLAEERNRTLLLVTHDPAVAAYCGRKRVLKDGVLEG